MAQRFDINNSGRQESEGLEPGYQPRTFGRVTNAERQFVTASGNTISITVTSVSGLDGNAVRTNYWKQRVVNLGYKLIADGGYTINLDDPTGGNNAYTDVSWPYWHSIDYKRANASDHTLLAYHNLMDIFAGNIAPLKVLCKGKMLATDVIQTSRATKISNSGYSL